MLQIKGKTRKPSIAQRGPAAPTGDSAAYGPPETSKKMRKTSGSNASFLEVLEAVSAAVKVVIGGGSG